MTLIRKIKGMSNKTGLKLIPLTVHFTSDNLGETLSIGSTEQGVQYTVAYEYIDRIVAREREKGYTEGHLIIEDDTDTELKPCPFCGSKPERADCIGCGYVMIRCPSCDAGISIVLKDKEQYTIEEAEARLIDRWNNRSK